MLTVTIKQQRDFALKYNSDHLRNGGDGIGFVVGREKLSGGEKIGGMEDVISRWRDVRSQPFMKGQKACARKLKLSSAAPPRPHTTPDSHNACHSSPVEPLPR